MGNINKICEYFLEGVNEGKQLGIELEHFICDDDFQMIPYEVLCEILEKIEKEINGKLTYDEGHIIGLDCITYGISLEPAGQVEISFHPTEDLARVEQIYDEFRRLWEPLLEEKGYRFVESGVHPLVESGEKNPEDFPLIPKKRYEYMDKYFQKSGRFGRFMMRTTASTQISIDYSSEKDAIRKIQILQKTAPLLALLMENHSGLGIRKEWKKHLLRTQIWDETDKERCGYFEGSLDAEYSFERYAKHVYESPMIFLKDKGEELNVAVKSAKDLCEERPFTFMEHMLSMFFPHIRLKKYAEIRVADSVPKDRMLGYAALIKGLMYSKENLEELEALFDHITSIEQIKKAEYAIMEKGYYAQVYGKTAVEWLYILYELAQKALSGESRNEDASDSSKKSDVDYLKGILTLPMLEYEYRKDIHKDRKGHDETAQTAKQYILNSTAKYHSRVPRTMYIPKMFLKDDIERFKGLVEELFGIFDRVMMEYQRNPDYRRLFGFDERTEELILKEEAYKCNVPMARIDFFYNEETKEFTFCEFNTDGTSAMNEDRELNRAMKLTKAHQEFSKNHRIITYELFDSWVDEFLIIYGEYAKKFDRCSVPNIVITDFLEHATINEFKIFRERFKSRQIPCEIYDIRKLIWDGEYLRTPEGMRVDAIYRRAVTSDILSHFDEVTDVIEAVKANAVCLVGEFRTQIVHNKILYKVLHLPETMKLLTKQQQRFVKAHVPYTVSLTTELFDRLPELKEEVLTEKDHWIIKPEDSYGSYGVHAGVEGNAKEWAEFVEKAMDQGYILQRFCTPYRLPNIDLLNEKEELRDWCTTSNLTGLFVYNGKMKGVYSRCSFAQMISTQYNEMTVASMVVEP